MSRSKAMPNLDKYVLWYIRGNRQFFGGIWDVVEENEGGLVLGGRLSYEYDSASWYEAHYYYDKRRPDRYAPKEHVHRAFTDRSIIYEKTFDLDKKCSIILSNELTVIESKTKHNLNKYRGVNEGEAWQLI